MNEYLRASIVIVISFCVMMVIDYQLVHDHEDLHADIFRRDGCQNVSIRAMALIGGVAECTDAGYFYSSQALELNTMVDVVGYHVRPFIFLIGSFFALAIIVGWKD